MQYVTPDKLVNSQCPRFILTKMYNSRGDQGYVVMIKSLLETALKESETQDFPIDAFSAPLWGLRISHSPGFNPHWCIREIT